MKLDRYKNHDIEVVIDKMMVKNNQDENRLKKSVATAMKAGDGLIMILDNDTNEAKFFSKRLMCPTTGMAYSDPAPNNFSFNSPQGACPKCKGLGVVNEIDMDKVIPKKDISIYNGAITPLGKYKNQMIFWQIDAVLKQYGFDLKTPVEVHLLPAISADDFSLEKVYERCPDFLGFLHTRLASLRSRLEDVLHLLEVFTGNKRFVCVRE